MYVRYICIHIYILYLYMCIYIYMCRCYCFSRKTVLEGGLPEIQMV